MIGAAKPTRVESPAVRPRVREELVRILVVVVGVALPFAVGVALGPRSRDLPLEPRFAFVIAPGTLASLLGLAWPLRGRTRRAVVAFGLVPLAHALWPSSVLLAALDAALLLGASTGALLYAAWRIGHASAPRRARALVLLALVLTLAGPHVTLAWGLVATVLASAVTRLAYRSPVVRDGELHVELASRDGTTLRASFAPGRPGAPGVVLVHGWSDARARVRDWADALSARGAHVLRMDLRGHGVSDGVLVTFADREPDDVAAAAEWLRSQTGVGAVHLLGVSMGGGAALVAASSAGARITSTVAIAPATDYRAIVRAQLPSSALLRAVPELFIFGVTHGLGHRAPLELRPIDAVVGAGPTRILVVHSRADRRIPPSHTVALRERAPWVEVEWVDGPAHNEMERFTASDHRVRQRIEAFLDLSKEDVVRRGP